MHDVHFACQHVCVAKMGMSGLQMPTLRSFSTHEGSFVVLSGKAPVREGLKVPVLPAKGEPVPPSPVLLPSAGTSLTSGTQSSR